MKTVNDIREEFIRKYKNKEFVEVRGFKTLEIINAAFLCDEDYVFKEPNKEYIQKEINWYLSQSLNVYDLDKNPPKAWILSADKYGNINSNYGHIVFSELYYNQFQRCLEHLQSDLYTRRAVLIYNRPSMHIEWNMGGKNDFVCTMYQQFLYRDNKLHLFVSMRSNDAVFGYRNDLAWAKYLLNKMVEELSKSKNIPIAMGNIYWHAVSFHIYEQHFKYIEEWIGGE